MEYLVILGVTGSIGQQTLEVVRQHPDKFKILGVSAARNIKQLEIVINEFEPAYVTVLEAETAELLKGKYPTITFFSGEKGLETLATIQGTTKLVNALIGFVGLKPTLAAIKAGINIALANKETLVAAGEIVSQLALKHQVTIIPIDSEHSAIFQCLKGNLNKEVKKIVLTASGGSFRDKSRAELKTVTVQEALKHPNWTMGAKITIDSATMMNKGLEVIEAHHLFQIPYQNIEVILHPESIIHSLVEFVDNSWLAQLGSADMMVPIQYALTYPKRFPLEIQEKLDLIKQKSLNFQAMSFERFPLLKLAYEVGLKGGNLPAIMNGANEAAVALFLEEKISFLMIEKLVKKTTTELEYLRTPSLKEIIASDQRARDYVYQLAKEH